MKQQSCTKERIQRSILSLLMKLDEPPNEFTLLNHFEECPKLVIREALLSLIEQKIVEMYDEQYLLVNSGSPIIKEILRTYKPI